MRCKNDIQSKQRNNKRKNIPNNKRIINKSKHKNIIYFLFYKIMRLMKKEHIEKPINPKQKVVI